MKTFINVEQMKLATLQAGQFVETGGYYAKGDAGAARYLIVAAQAFDGYGDHELVNGTIAVLQLVNDSFNAQNFGVLADWDGSTGTDNLLMMQAAFDKGKSTGKQVILPSGQMMVTGQLKYGQNSNIKGQFSQQWGVWSVNEQNKSSTIVLDSVVATTLLQSDGLLIGTSDFMGGPSIQNVRLYDNNNNSTGLAIEGSIYGTFSFISMTFFNRGVYCKNTISNNMNKIQVSSGSLGVEYEGLNETTDVWDMLNIFGCTDGIRINGRSVGLRFNNGLFEQITGVTLDVSAQSQSTVMFNCYAESIAADTNSRAIRIGTITGAAEGSINVQLIGGTWIGRNFDSNFGTFLESAIGKCVSLDGVYIRGWAKLFSIVSPMVVKVSASVIAGVIGDRSYAEGSVVGDGMLGTPGETLDFVYPNIHATTKIRTKEISMDYANGSPIINIYRNGGVDSGQLTLGDKISGLGSETAAYIYSGDNFCNLGLSNKRFKEIYCVNNVINTSDEREKTTLIDFTEKESAVAVKLKSLLKTFKWIESKEREDNGGKKARIHVGIGAQSLGKAFIDEGLNPDNYAMFCYDEWEAEGSIKPSDRYGVRLDQVLAFIIANT